LLRNNETIPSTKSIGDTMLGATPVNKDTLSFPNGLFIIPTGGYKNTELCCNYYCMSQTVRTKNKDKIYKVSMLFSSVAACFKISFFDNDAMQQRKRIAAITLMVVFLRFTYRRFFCKSRRCQNHWAHLTALTLVAGQSVSWHIPRAEEYTVVAWIYGVPHRRSLAACTTHKTIDFS